jgi:hypothetical protein
MFFVCPWLSTVASINIKTQKNNGMRFITSPPWRKRLLKNRRKYPQAMQYSYLSAGVKPLHETAAL